MLPGSSSPCSRRSQRSDPSERKTERDRQREGGKEGDTECVRTCGFVPIVAYVYMYVYIYAHQHGLLKGEGGSSSKTPTTIDDAVRLCATRVRLPRGLFVHAAKKWKERAGGRVEAS